MKLDKFLFIICLLFSHSEKCFSSWGLGAEFTYKCLSGDSYLIEYTVYRNCNSIIPPATANVYVTNSCGFADTMIQLTQVSSIYLSTVCPTFRSTCFGGSYLGIEKIVYQGTITLPGSCEWYFYRRESQRSAAISTTVGSYSDDLFTFFVIDNTNCPCQNSPVFRTSADFRVCVGQPFQFDPHMYDQEGDSISVSFTNPHNGPFESDTVQFLPGYSNSQFLMSNPLITIDHSTGIISGFAIQPDIGPYAIVVSEFRNGNLIGKTERDVIIFAENCANNVPELSGINGTPNFDIAIQPNVQSCFYVTSTDLDPSQWTTISYSDSINGLSVVTTSGYRDSAFICWTPSMSDVSPIPHCFDLNVADDNCPYLGISTRTFCITVDIGARIEEGGLSYIELSPNPVSDQMKITNAEFSNFIIEVYDIEGRKVIVKSVQGNETVINFSLVENGIYIMSVRSNDSKQFLWKKIVKSN